MAGYVYSCARWVRPAKFAELTGKRPLRPCGICGKPSNTAAHYGVSCCEEHNKQLRENKAGAQ